MSQELFETARYLRDHAKTDFRNMPEKSITRVLNNASPEVRKAMLEQYKGREHFAETGGRIDHNGFLAPFTPREEPPPIPKEMEKAIDRLRTEELTSILNQRMGSEQPDQPVTLRDIVSASMDAHENV